MQAAALRALEFDRVREILAGEAHTPLGRERALALMPLVEPAAIEAALALTAEAVSVVADGGSLAITATEDLAEILGGIEIADEVLGPLALLGLAQFLGSLAGVVAALRRPSSPRLMEVVQQAAVFTAETGAVERAIEPTGEVSDRASSALREIRESLRRQRARLRSTLEGLTRSRETAKYLQDQIVTDRNGRYVVVVRAEHRDAIPGIVHGSSTSGASLYLEPLSTVTLNNDVVTLVEREQAEIRRILAALTAAFRARGAELDQTVAVAARIDELAAKAALARRTEGIAPALTEDGRLEFLGARHPLLIPAVRDRSDDPRDTARRQGPAVVVASDLILVPPVTALVISGPNTGGKTVALKAAGLLALMAQSGLLIPVDRGSRWTPFRSIFADIGDEQSIAASLSTFSAHMANIVEMDRALERPALVLLDEVGGGTDPTEGGALGAAIVDHFRRRGALVIATTHDDTLKSYAATTEGVVTAGFGFHPETYAPTYRLLYGAPGRSLALEIAQRLGVPETVIAAARARQSSRESQLAAHLARLDAQLAVVERERESAAAERATASAEREKLLERESRLTEREAVLKRRLDERLNEKLRDAREEVDRVVSRLKQKADAVAAQVERRPAGRPVLSTGDVGALRSEARTELEHISQALGDVAPPPAPPLEQPPVAGDTVFVAALNASGIVRQVSGDRAEVEVRGKRIRVRVRDLRGATGDALSAGGDGGAGSRSQARPARPSPGERSRELVLIGSTVEQALDRAEKFLDDALLADEKRLRVVHGHGTGRLREALTKYFREHPLVASVERAPEGEGGGGATIVELKD